MINTAVRNLQRSLNQPTANQQSRSLSASPVRENLSSAVIGSEAPSIVTVTGEALNRSALRKLESQLRQPADSVVYEYSASSAYTSTPENLGEYARVAIGDRLKSVAASGASSNSNNGGAAQSAESQLNSITEQFQQRFASHAGDKDAFHLLMKKSFGESYDVSKAETIRQQTLAGDFSWMPDIKLVNGSALADVSGQQSTGIGLGAYSKENDTIFLSRDLLSSDPVKAEKILSEEIGHGLDARLNNKDAAGDEGEIFARLSYGESISEVELQALKAENDSGTILVDGKEVEVEYGWNPVKSIKKGLKRIGRSFKKGVKKIGNAIKSGFNKIMNSPLMGAILQVARFVPIPVVQGIAHIVNVAKAAYSVYQGVKHGSLGAVVGGLAGAAGGVANFGKFIGSAGSWVEKAASFAEAAGKASTAYRVLAQKDIGAALSYFSGNAGDNHPMANVLDGLSKVNAVYEAKKSGDFIGAIGLGSLILQDITGPKGNQLLQKISDNAESLSKFRDAYESGNYAGALGILGDSISATQGEGSDAANKIDEVQRLVANVQTVKNMMDAGDYAGAAVTLMNTAGMHSTNPETRIELINAAETITTIDRAINAVKAGDYNNAMAFAERALGSSLDDRTRQRVSTLYESAQQLNSLVSAIEESDVDASLTTLKNLLGDRAPSLINSLTIGSTLARKGDQLLSAVEQGDYQAASLLASDVAQQFPAARIAASAFESLSVLLRSRVMLSSGQGMPSAAVSAAPGIAH